ncbi:zinc ribbon domain-containing protein [Peptococcus simiae]|uniref:zinc ribbon domain-containing protein n=1 Tax=Peptococcus simiae TaxID=1643805 RepID=UPI00398057EA
MYCNHCGNQLSAGDLFCSQCGSKVEQKLVEPWDLDDNDFDSTRLYDPQETLDQLNKTAPVEIPRYDGQEADRPSAGHRAYSNYYERESSARAAQRLSRRWQDAKESVYAPKADQAPAAGRPEPVQKENKDKEGSLFNRFSAKLGYGPEARSASGDQAAAKAKKKTWVSEKKKAKVRSHQDGEAPNYRSLYAGIVILGIVIGVILGLLLVKPWSNGNSEPQPVATGVVAPVELAQTGE